MNSLEEARYRLVLAEGYLERAERFFAQESWHDCVRDAQASVENAGKAVVARFVPVERSRDPVRQILTLLENNVFPEKLRPLIERGIPAFSALGFKEHIQVTYGDEETYTPPWELFDRADAEESLRVAKGAVKVARQVVA